MKVVHLNNRNLEREKIIAELGREVAERRNALEMKRFLRLKAKYEATKIPGVPSVLVVDTLGQPTSSISCDFSHSIY